ncbi:hypothetical protein K493DRAFT_311702 [Basidiobolus meristosporus CBS 931.73]|uniref:Kinetochore protein SPC25 n=1 Tax=Basidiobolus meristosporus CBS 931.73 TaxID=1314790 RepID=A0A1Y1Z0U4_9FUNG|nr:hypothetical protein K493DRAFT_311702 [Basidiobolus meristosporus CBS 931.73]|eukprot:ORY03435.1 hypothetical protein K493DRAFT_311702 [Basidiobolus meristosporus CBS 931.73]
MTVDPKDTSTASLTSTETLSTPDNILPIGNLAASIADFLQQLEGIAEHEIEKISERRKLWEKEMDVVEASNTQFRHELRELKDREKLYSELQVEESRALSELKTDLLNLKKRQEEVKFNMDELRLRIELKRDAIARKKEERAEVLEALRLQRKRNQLRLNACEDSTCMRIYGAQEDKITFIFTEIREDKPHREHAFTVDVSQEQYQVTECFPRLKELDQIVEWVNTTGDFYTFLKKMRASFAKNSRKRNQLK